MFDSIEGIAEEVRRLAANPQGVSVLVVTPNEGIARHVAPMLADRLHPGRTWGEILHVEWAPASGGWEVVVRDRGPRYAHTVS
jgi:hypothetical protein